MRAARTIPTTRNRLRRWLLATALAATLLILLPAAALAGAKPSQAAGESAKVEANRQPTPAPEPDQQSSKVLIWVVAGIAVLAIMTPSGSHHHYRDPYYEHWH